MSADATPSAPEHLTFRAADGQRVAATRFPGLTSCYGYMPSRCSGWARTFRSASTGTGAAGARSPTTSSTIPPSPASRTSTAACGRRSWPRTPATIRGRHLDRATPSSRRDTGTRRSSGSTSTLGRSARWATSATSGGARRRSGTGRWTGSKGTRPRPGTVRESPPGLYDRSTDRERDPVRREERSSGARGSLLVRSVPLPCRIP